jgi:membrane protein
VALLIGLVPILFLFSSTLMALLPSDLVVRVSRTGWLPAVIRAFASPVIYFALFGALLKYLPQAKVSWRAVWPGALLTAVLFWIGSVVLGWYLQNSAIQSLYGAAGSAIALLLWAYYSAWILLFGAKFVQVYAEARGYAIVPHHGVGYVDRLAPSNEPPRDVSGT